MSDFIYKKGLEHAKTFEKKHIASNDISAKGKYVNYIKNLAAEYNDQYLSGVADGLWREVLNEQTNCFNRR